jgi:hypothetical protein
MYNGICEVCHIQTTYHDDIGSGASHNEGTDCTRCHDHLYGFAHGAGSGGSVNCVECHGHDAGTNFDPDKTAPYTAGSTASQGKGTYQSHSTHTETDSDDSRGPGIYCDGCHDVGNFPFFKSGIDGNVDGKYSLSETDVCDICHSPGGSYDGIDDPVIGAKNNWDSGVYTGASLTAGKEKWCATCHDESLSVIQGVSAPNVIGDEDQNTNYGIGYGYYKTGHGLSEGLYPASQAPAANIDCMNCHDSSTAHIDGEHRTYLAANDNYQAGYRLKDVGGGPPMDIPRSGQAADDFALCFACHESDPFLVQNDYDTNFRNDSTGVNSHWYHLMSTRPYNDWDSNRRFPDKLPFLPQCAWIGVPQDGPARRIDQHPGDNRQGNGPGVSIYPCRHLSDSGGKHRRQDQVYWPRSGQYSKKRRLQHVS